MSPPFGWPDIIVVAILGIATFKGYRNGFVSELSGTIALAAALIVPWYYSGFADTFLQVTFKLGPGSAHVIGLFLTGLAAYVAVIALAWFLNGVVKLPLLGIGNALGGAFVGFLKGALLVWFVLFVALYFPLSPDIREDLHAATLPVYFTKANAGIDAAIQGALPWFAKPVLNPYFSRHHV